MRVLLDHHMKKQGVLLWGALENEGWLALLEIPMLTFADVGLPIDSSDRDVWRFVQKRRLILLTGNRNNDGKDSLQQTIQDENQPTSLTAFVIARATARSNPQLVWEARTKKMDATSRIHLFNLTHVAFSTGTCSRPNSHFLPPPWTVY